MTKLTEQHIEMETYTVYRHTNPINNEVFYIGKGTDSNKRRNVFWQHKSDEYKKILKDIRGAHLAPIVEVLNTTTEEETAFYLEQMHINYYGRKDLNNGSLVNRTDGGAGASGAIVSNETRDKLSEAKKGENHPMYGKKHSDESRNKMSESRDGMESGMKGKKHSNDTKRKMSIAHSNVSDETRRKISEATKGENNPNYGKKHSAETRKKISEAASNMSDETRKKMSEARKGKPLSDETKRNMSIARKGEKNPNYGKHFSDESKLKMSIARKAYHANRKLKAS